MILNQTIIADVLVGLKQIPDNSIHCVVTSPPYWGLREYRENGKALEGQIGLEKTPEEFIEKMVAVFREVRRVLRPDGTCWINLGDSYASGKGTCFNPGGGDSSLGKDKKSEGAHPLDRGNKSDLEASGLKPKDLVGIPWRVALALQADGWWLRSDIIWSKPNPMPESVTDRPSKSHEYIFLLTKSARYFYDADAVREAHKPESIERDKHGWSAAFKGRHTQPGEKRPHSDDHNGFCNPAGRNLRSVWTIATQPSPFKHYAIFPEKLASRCIRAGTSEWGCCKSCGAPYVRVVEKDKKLMGRSSGDIYTAQAYDTPQSAVWGSKKNLGGDPSNTKTLGFRPSCDCPDNKPVPCVVLDPFHGSGTTGKVAQDLHRDWIGIDLGYKELSDKRTQQGTLI